MKLFHNIGLPLFPKVDLTQKLFSPEQAVPVWQGLFNLPMEMWREACCKDYFRANQTNPINQVLGEALRVYYCTEASFIHCVHLPCTIL